MDAYSNPRCAKDNQFGRQDTLQLAVSHDYRFLSVPLPHIRSE